MDGMIWFKAGGMVRGMPVEEVNQYIREWNKLPDNFRNKEYDDAEHRSRCFVSFMNWRIFEATGEDWRLDDFSALWNYKNTAMRELIKIK